MDHLIITKIIQDLERGRNSAHYMKDLFNQRGGSAVATHDHHDYHYKGLDDHSTVALAALDSALSLLHNPHSFSLDDNKSGNSKSHDSAAEASKKVREIYCKKRRRGELIRMFNTTNLTDDGFSWRKYGQKETLGVKHPRNYYRCSYKKIQGCPATKQVQQISEDPTKYEVIYRGQHACEVDLKNSSILIDSTIPEHQDSSVFPSSQTNTAQAKRALNPSPNHLSFSNSAVAMVKQEHGAIKEETQSQPSVHHNGQYNSSPSSPDLTITSRRSEMSSAEVCSSVARPHSMDMEEGNYSRMMTDANSIDLDRFLQGLVGP